MSSGLWPYAPQWRLYLPGIGVEHDDALVAVPVGDVQFVGLRIDEHLRRPFQVFDVVAAFALERMPDLHQEFSVLRELQNLIVGEGARLACFGRGAGPGLLHLGIHGAAVPANPDIALVVDGNSVVGVRPVVALAGSAPVPNQVAGFIEFENGRRGDAAIRARADSCCHRFPSLRASRRDE